ncbi:3-isopropylmalate dehydratase small subunit [Marinobacterium lacunae]|uniref:3-isopropylmalate dehydratase small subunit n=1 Tax=Marinobacterium lacunae TaxID=1232683 RepID=A0A081FUD1_9GAMM|nr:3-isopropylmalate dehydratase small subunit [Marinobacterium lacunae]KEA62136.1 3-isopropylmalate dehydratase small subunit [Marinobacterium lacunae]
MQPFNRVSGTAAPLLAANIDTDVIMPKQFLKGIDRNGLARGTFFDQRFLEDGTPNPQFILNQPAWGDVSFLVVGPNFGCGSSREHAVWGLQQLGIRALVGTSFAGIFYDNCQRNGVLLIQLESHQLERLGETISNPERNKIVIDLPQQTISLADGESLRFEIDSLRKASLVKGLDAIDSTLERAELIRQFQQQHWRDNPWLQR